MYTGKKEHRICVKIMKIINHAFLAVLITEIFDTIRENYHFVLLLQNRMCSLWDPDYLKKDLIRSSHTL